MSKWDEIWPFKGRRLAIQTTVFSAWIFTFSILWFSITITTKKRLLHTLLFSIASYGSECWVLKNIDKKKIEAFELWCYRRLLRISWTEKKTNEWILNKMDGCKRETANNYKS